MNERGASGWTEDPAAPASARGSSSNANNTSNSNGNNGGGGKSKSKGKGKSRSNNVRTQEVQMSYNKPINIPDINVLLADPPSSQSSSNHSDTSSGKIRRGSLDKNKRPVVEHSASDPLISRDRPAGKVVSPVPSLKAGESPASLAAVTEESPTQSSKPLFPVFAKIKDAVLHFASSPSLIQTPDRSSSSHSSTKRDDDNNDNSNCVDGDDHDDSDDDKEGAETSPSESSSEVNIRTHRMAGSWHGNSAPRKVSMEKNRIVKFACDFPLDILLQGDPKAVDICKQQLAQEYELRSNWTTFEFEQIGLTFDASNQVPNTTIWIDDKHTAAGRQIVSKMHDDNMRMNSGNPYRYYLFFNTEESLKMVQDAIENAEDGVFPPPNEHTFSVALCITAIDFIAIGAAQQQQHAEQSPTGSLDTPSAAQQPPQPQPATTTTTAGAATVAPRTLQRVSTGNYHVASAESMHNMVIAQLNKHNYHPLHHLEDHPLDTANAPTRSHFYDHSFLPLHKIVQMPEEEGVHHSRDNNDRSKNGSRNEAAAVNNSRNEAAAVNNSSNNNNGSNEKHPDRADGLYVSLDALRTQREMKATKSVRFSPAPSPTELPSTVVSPNTTPSLGTGIYLPPLAATSSSGSSTGSSGSCAVEDEFERERRMLAKCKTYFKQRNIVFFHTFLEEGNHRQLLIPISLLGRQHVEAHYVPIATTITNPALDYDDDDDDKRSDDDLKDYAASSSPSSFLANTCVLV